jgi:hypothetical protein
MGIFFERVIINPGGWNGREDFHIYGKSIIWKILRDFRYGFIGETFILS